MLTGTMQSQGRDQRKKDINILLLGTTFFLVFTAFFTMGNIQTVVIENAQDPDSEGYVEGFTGDGYVSLSIVNALAAVTAVFAASIRACLGVKLTLVLGSATFAVFIATFYVLSTELLYVGSAIMGFGSALLWVCQGVFLTLNSTPETITRNTGIFYVMFQSSGVVGNTVSYFYFGDTHDIPDDTRNSFVTILLVLSALGALAQCFTFSMPWAYEMEQKSPDTVCTGLKRTVKLFTTSQMQLLLFVFVYTAIHFSFWTGVYGPSLSFTQSFENPRRLTGLHGILMAVGAIMAGLGFMVLGKHTAKYGRWPVMVLGMICTYTAYTLIFFNIPKDAPLGETDSAAIIDPSSVPVAIVTSLVFGFGDGCYGTQILALLGSIYSDQSAPAFAVFKLVQHASMAVAFGYAGHLNLYGQLGVIAALGIVGIITFAMVDIRSRKLVEKK